MFESDKNLMQAYGGTVKNNIDHTSLQIAYKWMVPAKTKLNSKNKSYKSQLIHSLFKYNQKRVPTKGKTDSQATTFKKKMHGY